jgi:hypothetical protein
VALALCTDPSSDNVPSLGDLRDLLGALGTRLADVTIVSPDAWIQRPKGTVDRTAMSRQLRNDAAPS